MTTDAGTPTPTAHDHGNCALCDQIEIEVQALRAAHEAAQAEIAALREDAERYRWLRTNCRVTAEARNGYPEHAALVYYYGLKTPKDMSTYAANGLDAAIDAARKAK